MYKEGNIVLRAMQEEDLKKSIGWVNDADTARAINRFSPVSYANHLNWFHSIINDPKKTVFAIDSEDGEYVGNCGLSDIDFRNRKAELWIYLSKESTGKGYGLNATTALIKYGYNKLNLNRIYLYVMGYNNPAISLYKKLGFEHEGVFKENFYIDGKYEDTVHMALLRKNFKL